MKRLVCFLLSFVMAATLLTGCGGSGKEENAVDNVTS